MKQEPTGEARSASGGILAVHGREDVKPTRIQLRRTAGWRKPEGAIVVARPTFWGNPFRPVRVDGEWWAQDENDVRYPLLHNTRDGALRRCVGLYRNELVQWSEKCLRLPELRGHDLACWCSLDMPCHADVLLELANGGADAVLRQPLRVAEGGAGDA